MNFNPTEESELLYRAAFTEFLKFHGKWLSESEQSDLFFWAGALMALCTNWQELPYYQAMWEVSVKTFEHHIKQEAPKDPRRIHSWETTKRLAPLIEKEIERIRNKYGILPEA